MGSRLSMAARAEITVKYARAYLKASKKDKGRLLDEVIAVTGWSRDNAPRRPAKVAAPRPRAVAKARKPRARAYSSDATTAPRRGGAFAGAGCGKDLSERMPVLLAA